MDVETFDCSNLPKLDCINGPILFIFWPGTVVRRKYPFDKLLSENFQMTLKHLFQSCMFHFSASLSNIGQLLGALLTGWVANQFGRKRAIMLLCVPLAFGWTIVGLSRGSVHWICVGRVCQGIGIMSSVTQVYLIEIADVNNRSEPIYSQSIRMEQYAHGWLLCTFMEISNSNISTTR